MIYLMKQKELYHISNLFYPNNALNKGLDREVSDFGIPKFSVLYFVDQHIGCCTKKQPELVGLGVVNIQGDTLGEFMERAYKLFDE